MHVSRGVVGWWLVALAVYLSFVTFVWTQVVAGAVVATLAVTASLRALRTAGMPASGGVPRVWRLRAIAAILTKEAGAVLRALGRAVRGGPPIAGRSVAVPLEEEFSGRLDVALTLEASLAPNTYVIATFPEDGLVLTHQFEPAPGVRRSFPRWRR